ncbi:MAG: hypothetical protein V1495_04970 [Pseudomonadota bacterium]
MTLFTVLARITWVFLGPGMMLIVLVKNLSHSKSGVDSIWTFIYFGLLAAVILGRLIEQRSGAATTAKGEPSTWRHYWRFAIIFTIVSVACWGGVQLVP